MTVGTETGAWTQFLACLKSKTSVTAYNNWISPIEMLDFRSTGVTLQVPNIFVKEYLMNNFREELLAFFPITIEGDPAVHFQIQRAEKPQEKVREMPQEIVQTMACEEEAFSGFQTRLNESYRFETYIEGPSNQFVKSAAMGVALRPGQSYNPLFIHGGVGLGKTHLLHGIGHRVKEIHKRLRVVCVTTESFINQIVDALRNKSIDKLKRFYRNSIDVLLVDDIQFLQNRPNFEEEFCNTFEALIHAKKQVVITSDKPPAQLNLSERMIARMEWGLVANVGIPDLETRVAILQHKAELKGLKLPTNVAFLIGEHIYNNVRQLEGAVNRLSAYYRLLNDTITEELVEKLLQDMFQASPTEKITIDDIFKSVAAVFQVSVASLKGSDKKEKIAVPRQVAMFLAKELINESLVCIANSFGKTHSTVIHAAKTIEKKLSSDESLRRQIEMVRRNLYG